MYNNIRSRCAICQRRLDNLGSSRLTISTDNQDNETLLKKYNDFRTGYFPDNITVIREGDLICKQCHTCIYQGTPPKSKRLSRTSSLVSQTSTVSYTGASTNEISLDATMNIDEISVDVTNDVNFVPNENEERLNYLSQKNKIQLMIPRANCSHKICIVCGINNELTKLCLVPIEAILDCYIQKDIMIKSGCRSCVSHLNDCNKFTVNALEMIGPIGQYIELDESKLASKLISFVLASVYETVDVCETKLEVLESLLDFGEVP